MQEKYNEATRNRPEGDRPIDAPLVSINLPAYIQQIREEEAWQKNDRNAITVFKTDVMRLVLVGLHANAEMKPHTAEGDISVHVLEGKIKFSTQAQSVELEEGQVVTLHQGISHSVVALEEAIFLLTMVKGNK